MAYVKDSPPTGASQVAQQAYQERELTKIELEDQELRRQLGVVARLIAVNGVLIEWLWNDTTPLTDPGSGQMGGDAVQMTAFTVLRMSNIDVYGRDVVQLFPLPPLLKANDFLRVTNPDRSQSAAYLTTGPATFENGWFWVPVAYQAGGGGNPSSGNNMTLRYSPDYAAILR